MRAPRTSNAQEMWKVAESSSEPAPAPRTGSVRSQYARSSTSASRSASFPSAVGSTLSRPARNRLVASERAAPRIRNRNSSRKPFSAARASGLSLIGRMSERMTSAEWEDMYEGPRGGQHTHAAWRGSSLLTFGHDCKERKSVGEDKTVRYNKQEQGGSGAKSNPSSTSAGFRALRRRGDQRSGQGSMICARESIATA